MGDYNTIKYEVRGKVAYLMFDRGDKMNTLTNEMESEIREALLEFDLDDDAWVMILYGSGKAFCAGVDLRSHTSFNIGKTEEERSEKELGALKTGHTGGAMHLRGTGGEGWMGRTINYKPVIGAVHGYALGGGAHLAAECDLLVVAEDTQMAISETTVGMSGSRTWAKLKTFMPSKIASEMLITGRRVSGAELHRLGLANRLAETGKHLEVAEELAQIVLAAPPLAVRDGVRVTRKQWVGLATDLDMQMQLTRLQQTEDYKEAGRAFAEKRKPIFQAR